SYHLINDLIEKVDLLSKYTDLYAEINKNHSGITAIFSKAYVNELNSHTIQNIRNLINENNIFDKTITLDDMDDSISKLEEIKTALLDLKPDIELINKNIPYELKSVFGYSEENFSEMKLLVGHLKGLPFDLRKHRNEIFDESSNELVILAFESIFDKIHIYHQYCQTMYKIKNIPSVEELEIIYRNICIGGLFIYFTRQWCNARKCR